MKDRSLYLEVSSCCPAMEVIDCTNSFWKALTLARDKVPRGHGSMPNTLGGLQG